MDIEDPLRRLAEDLAASVCKIYRLERTEAVRRILAEWEQDAALRAALSSVPDLEKLKRMRVYKDAANSVRKKIYFGLRRYHADGASLLTAVAELEALAPGSEPARAQMLVEGIAAAHASTAERKTHLPEFWQEILAAIGDARTLLDVGAGVLPILLPVERVPHLQRYVACDRDKPAMAAVAAFGRWSRDERLKALTWDLSEGWASVVAAGGVATFDVALMLKLVPAVKRQKPSLLEMLGHVPARRIVVTGSKEALVKRRAIARREHAVIEAFVTAAGFRLLHAFETPDEVGIVADRAPLGRAQAPQGGGQNA